MARIHHQANPPALNGLDWDIHPLFWIVLAACHAVVLSNLFHPHYDALDPWDESNYINFGRILAHGYPPYYALNPLVAVLYGGLYILLRHETFWMLLASGAGRSILFGLNWLATYLIARQVRRIVPPLVMAGFLFVTPALPLLLLNSSDAAFAAFSGLAFWKTLLWVEHKGPRDLWQAAWFVALSAFCRNDGSVLALCLAVIVALTERGEDGDQNTSHSVIGAMRRHLRRIAICFAPLAGLVIAYTLVHFALTHDLRPGSRSRTYVAFEQGQYIAYASTGRYPGGAAEGLRDCERLYGTMEENHRSVLSAIRRNPRAWVGRIIQNARTVPVLMATAYGQGAFLIVALAVLGVIQLRRQLDVLRAALIWPLFLLIYLGLFYRAGYLCLPYECLALLTGTGLGSLSERLPVPARSWALGAAFALMLVLARPRLPTWPQPYGTSSGEEALRALHRQAPESSRVAAISPKMLVMDSRRLLYLPQGQASLDAAGGFAQWMIRNRIAVAVIEPELKSEAPKVYDAAQKQIGTHLHVLFRSRDGRFLLVAPISL